jgi:hypothetical protein
MDWKTVPSTFGLIFLAELGDKAQLACIGLACPNGVYSGGIWSSVCDYWSCGPDIWLGATGQRSDDAGVGS